MDYSFTECYDDQARLDRLRNLLTWKMEPSCCRRPNVDKQGMVRRHVPKRAHRIDRLDAVSLDAKLLIPQSFAFYVPIATQGWELTADGGLQPRVLASLSGRELTYTFCAYTWRVQQGSLDSPRLAETAKDLLKTVAAHVLMQKRGSSTTNSNFPTCSGRLLLRWGVRLLATSLGQESQRTSVLSGNISSRLCFERSAE